MELESINDAIAVYNNVLPDKFCGFLTSQFEENIKYAVSRVDSEGAHQLQKNDLAVYLHEENTYFTESFNGENPKSVIWSSLNECFHEYTTHYPYLKTVTLVSNTFKIQKTSRGGGYHMWHSEHGDRASSSRAIVYMIYLNTLPSSGETEFIHQERKISPVENTAVFWPAAYTHTHRGNTVYGTVPKYIITGWFCYN